LQEVEESEVIKDFRSGKLDPASEINKMKKHSLGTKGTIKNKISDEIISKMH
jgi:hypothetical protein